MRALGQQWSERERELLLCFGHAEVRKKRAGSLPLGRKGKGIYTPGPQRSLKSQIVVGKEREKYIFPQPSMDTAPKRSGETRTQPKGQARQKP